MDSNMDSMIIENEMIVPVSIEFGEDFSREELDQLCRLCGNSSHQLMPIFSGDGNEHKLPDKIREHLPIIEVSKSDTLPLSMCYQCASTLISWHELYYACKEADQRLKELCARLNLRKSKSDEDLMDIHESSLENDDDIDSFETTELPREQGTPSKSEIIVPGELKEETTFDDTYNVSESFVEKTEESVTIETNNSTITESQSVRAQRDDENAKAKTEPISVAVAATAAGKDRRPVKDELNVCVVCHVKHVGNSEFCDNCSNFKPVEVWLQSPAPLTTLTDNYDRFMVVHDNGIAYMKCDKCVFICRPIVDVFSSHYVLHSTDDGEDGTNGHPTLSATATAGDCPAADNGRDGDLDGDILMKCAKCNQLFADDATLSAHYSIHTLQKLACKVCNRTFKTKVKLQIHKRKHSTKVTATATTIKCGRCDKEFKTQSGYKHHRAKVCVEYRCELCGQIFLVKSLLNGHLKKEHDVEVAQKEEVAGGGAASSAGSSAARRPSGVCSVCGKKINESAMTRHMQLHSDEKPYECAMCGKQFRIKWSLREHIMIEIGMKDYVCEVCGKKFVIQAYLNKHMRFHLMCDGKFEGFQCEMCGKKFAEEWRVKEHQRNAHRAAEKGRQYACNLCERKFARKWLVRSHKRAAHDEYLEQYQCEHCAKTFTEKWMIKLHLQTLHHETSSFGRHVDAATGDEKYGDGQEYGAGSGTFASSHVVNKLFEYNKMITGTERRGARRDGSAGDASAAGGSSSSATIAAATTVPKKLFECELCGKSFATKQGMKNHVYAELNMRKYVCEICGKRYNWWMGLKEHSIMTHGIKEFACMLCSKEFPTKKRYKDHMSVHSEERPYNCECGNVFKLKRYLKKHQKRCCKSVKTE